MKILVTGGAGFVGMHLIKRLLKEGHEVHSLDNYDSGLRENEIEGCNYVSGDIEQIEYWRGDKFDMVYHLAALSRIQPSFENPIETFRVNVRGTEAVCEWARHNNVRVIYAGSSSQWHDPFQSPYAMYKKLGEDICKMYKKVFGLSIEIVRFYNVYGPHEITEGKWAAVIGKWRGQVAKNHPITIVGDGEQRRDFTHIDDIVDGLVKIGFTTESHEDAWELGTGFNYSLNEVADMFIQKFSAVRVYMTEQKGNYRETKRVNDDAIQRLGWQPKDRLKEYIENLEK
jgi:UDP-glucose 4-epimerase